MSKKHRQPDSPWEGRIDVEVTLKLVMDVWISSLDELNNMDDVDTEAMLRAECQLARRLRYTNLDDLECKVVDRRRRDF